MSVVRWDEGMFVDEFGSAGGVADGCVVVETGRCCEEDESAAATKVAHMLLDVQCGEPIRLPRWQRLLLGEVLCLTASSVARWGEWFLRVARGRWSVVRWAVRAGLDRFDRVGVVVGRFIP